VKRSGRGPKGEGCIPLLRGLSNTEKETECSKITLSNRICEVTGKYDYRLRQKRQKIEVFVQTGGQGRRAREKSDRMPSVSE